jgi:hypothetical protein
VPLCCADAAPHLDDAFAAQRVRRRKLSRDKVRQAACHRPQLARLRQRFCCLEDHLAPEERGARQGRRAGHDAVRLEMTWQPVSETEEGLELRFQQ